MRRVWPLPIRGQSRAFSVDKTEPVFSDYMLNIFPTDVSENRLRLGKRPGLAKWSTTQIGGTEQPVVHMVIISTTT